MKNTTTLFFAFIISVFFNYETLGQQISTGFGHTLITCNGAMWSVGVNPRGNLGIGNNVNQNVFTQIMNPFFTNVSKVDVSSSSSIILLNDGSVWTFGDNRHGQLGVNNFIDSNIPLQVLGVNGNGFLQNIVDIDLTNVNSTSPATTALALSSSGNVFQWGFNHFSATDNPTPEYVYISPTQLLNNIDKISTGYFTSFALDSNGQVWAWGNDGGWGALGNGNTNSLTEYAQPVSGLNNVIDIKAGYSMCLALRNDGTVWAWGFNNSGVLGDGTTINRGVPVQVKGPNNVGYLNNIVSIEASTWLSYAIKNDGTLWTWGDNSQFGRMGNPSINNYTSIPVQVSGVDGVGFLNNVTSVSSHLNTTVATLNYCEIVGWGANDFDQIGIITQSTYNTPRLLDLSSVSCCGPLVIDSFAEYKANKTTVCPGETINIEAIVSSGNPTVTNWIALGASSISNTSGLTTQITYNTPGVYSIGAITSLSPYPTFNLIEINVLPANSRKCKYEINDDDYDGNRITKDITIYPNPSSSVFNIETKNTTNFSYKVNNIFGKTILSNSVKNINTIKVDLSKQEKGIYFLILTTEKGDETYKLIKE